MKSKLCTRVAGIIVVVGIAATIALTNLAWISRTWAMPAEPHHSFLAGPWDQVLVHIAKRKKNLRKQHVLPNVRAFIHRPHPLSRDPIRESGEPQPT